MLKINKKIFFITGGILFAAAFLVFIYIKPFFESAITAPKDEPYVLIIPTGSGYEEVMQTLINDRVLQNEKGFRRVSEILGYNKSEVPPGKYFLHEKMTTKTVISKLRAGDQDPINVVVNNVRTIHELAGKIAGYFESDSTQFIEYFLRPEVHAEYNVTAESILTLFIPNTYQFFWTTKPEKFLQRMKKEHDIFWSQEKLNKIKKHGLSPIQTYALASIVEKESNYAPERPAIAGVYLNRLKQGMKLQADPTVVFATGQYDLKRVLYTHLETDSPYNTYKYPGIPPGPIYMPSISSLEAVINAEEHSYIFFCAKPDNSGQHAFATTLDEHDQNAKAFSNWLNNLGIK